MDQPAPAALTSLASLHELPAGLGISPGHNIVLSADVTRLAWIFRRAGVKDVPRMLLDAFLSRIGTEGTLVIPTFNHDLRSGETFDPLLDAPITGAIATAALAHPLFTRTRHPLHSFAVAGRLQDRFMQLDDASSFSLGSPFALLRKEGFITVGLDMDLDYAFSYFHHVEELEQVPYRTWRDVDITYIERGVAAPRRFRSFAKRWGYANRLRDLAPLLEQAGAMVRSNLSGVRTLTVDLRAAHTVIEKDIRENKARSIVHFTWRNWLRDAWRSIEPAPTRSRSATRTQEDHARPH